MLTLNKKFKKDVKAAQDTIEQLTIEQHIVFTTLCKAVGVEDDTPDAECLWNHVFNQIDWTIKFK